MARACTLLLFCIVLVCLSIEDLKIRKISDGYHVAILLFTLMSFVTIPEITLLSRVSGMFAVSVPMTFLALFLPASFGGGDVKLTFACGAFLGWQLVVHGTIIAVFLAGIYCLWLIFIKRERKNVQFAFGPFLSIGFILSIGNL